MAKKPLFTRFILGLNHFKRSFKNFFKSSFLSLLIITIILLLLTQMDQAFTMMVDLIENEYSRFSLFLAILFINALAIVLSHYPIYTYYAANLNNSGNYTLWKEKRPLNFWPFKKFPVFVFTTDKTSSYKPDNWANYLRYSIGLLIHFVWIHFIISSFAPNLIFENFPLSTLKMIIYPLLLVPLIAYIILKEKFTKYESRDDEEGNPLSETIIKQNGVKLQGLHKRLGITYFLVAFLSLLLLIITLFIATFSPAGLLVLLLTSYVLMFNYVFFRLLRTRLSRVRSTLKSTLLLPVHLFISNIGFLQKSENYLAFFNFNFVVSIAVLVYSTIASIKGWGLNNGIPILLAFFYFYYFIIASLGKYFFVAKKLSLFNTRRFKIIFAFLAVAVLFIFIGKIGGFEVRTHELDLVENNQMEISEQQFFDNLKEKDSEALFFIASHGGGLKANVWTLNVLNTLQKETEGKLLDNTVALSGASGGSLGLALYTGFYKVDGRDIQTIQHKIDTLSHQNYTSIDLSFTFGLDTYRKLWPLNQRIGVRDRPYYKMRKYQNHIEDEKSELLSVQSFRDYWKQTYQKTGYFPSLIMNTAGLKGNRGILWSVKQKDFNAVFPYAENLADLTGNKTLPFYQAVSTTNRFPVFSPAAKIPGYGHYIDAGAIDNSGLLGCFDVHNYMLRNGYVSNTKTVAYIEIINSKSLYTNYLLEKFKEENNIQHIDKNENETDNIVADLQIGLNLDKIPGYLSDYMSNWTESPNYDIRYFQLFMPHKVSLDDATGFLGGELNGNGVKEKLSEFLDKENNEILALTEKPEKSFFDSWEFYEPTLSRHLSKSSIRYVKAILEHPLLRRQFDEINELAKPKVTAIPEEILSEDE
ncbi:MAG: patatin-like phospholipase family protein [Bacteroidota bacterium]